MNCKKIQKHLSAYVDGQVGKTLQSRIEAHLQTCDQCRAKVEQFRQTWEWLGEDIDIQPSPFFSAKIRRRIRKLEAFTETQPQWLCGLERFLIPATVAAGLVLGIFLGSQLMSEMIGSSRSSSAAAEIINASAEVFSELPQGSFTAAYEELGFLDNES